MIISIPNSNSYLLYNCKKKTMNYLRILILISIANIHHCLGQETTEDLSKDADSLKNEYIIDHKKRFNVKLEVGNEVSSFNLIENENEAELQPNLNIRYALVFSYKFLSIRIGIRPRISESEEEKKGKTDSFRLKLQLLFDKWNHVLEYNKFKGFYVANSSDFIDDKSGNSIQFPNLKTQVLFGSSVYKFNKNYSMRAIQSQTEIQSKSAGSFMPGVAFTFYSISGTDLVKNIEEGETIARDFYNEYTGLNLSIQLGYYYTFVLKQNWFLNAYGIPAAGIDFYTVDINTPNISPTRSYKDTFLSFSYGFGGGYNGDKIFFGASYKTRFTNEKFNSSRLHIIPTKDEYSIYFGYRFRAPKTISKPIEFIEDKVPILKDDKK